MRDPARTACSAPNSRAHGRAILLLSLLLTGAGGTPGITEAPILSVPLDADGDGRADTVDVFRYGLVLVRRSVGGASQLRYAEEAGPLRSTAVEIQAAGPDKRERYLVVRSVTLSGATRLVVAAATASLRLVYEGPVGPVGRDGEYAVWVSATAAGLLRSQSAPGVQRCDGEGRLFPSRWRWPDGPWQPAPEVTLPDAAALAKLPRLAATAPGPAEAGAPLGVYRFVAASAQGSVQRADLLAPPRELEDGSPVSAWQPAAAALGAFVTARADGRDHTVRAVRLTPAKDPRLGGLPRQILIVLTGDGRGEGQRFVAELAARPGREPLVVTLPQPVPASCVSLVIVNPSNPVNPGEPQAVAIGEAAIFSELDGGEQAASRLVQRIVDGDQVASEGALRTLQLVLSRPGGQLGAARQALGEALPKARGAARRRLYQILQSLAEARPASAEDASALAGLLQQALLGAEDADRPVLWASLAMLGDKGAAEIQRMALDPARAPAVRGEALERLGALPPPSALQALLGARELSPPAGAQLLQRGFQRGVSAALRCRPATEERWELARRALAGAWPGAEGADPGRAALLVEGTTQALAGCEATEARAQLGELLGTLWQRLDSRPSERPGEREPDAVFTLRLRVLQGLARLAAPGAVPFLRRVLESGAEPELRQAAVRAAGLQGAPPASPPAEIEALLGKGLGDADAGVRLAATVALAERPVAGLVPPIEKVLAGDAWPLVRRAAAEARAAQCVPSAPAGVEALRRATADPDEQVQRQALLGVVRCEGGAALSVLNKLLTGAETPPGTRGHACALSARLLSAPAGAAEARAEAPRALAAALGELLGDPAADDRHAGALLVCARAVGEAGGSGEVGALLSALAEGTPAPMRRSVLGALTRLCGRTHLVGLSARDRKDLTSTLATQAADAATKEAAAAAQAACR